MDKSAIQQIQETGSANAFLAQLGSAGFPIAALPDSYSLHDLERFMPNLNQYRGEMLTKNVTEFARYAAQYEKEGSQCFIDQDKMRATVIFDLGDQDKPGHRKHRTIVQLEKTADFNNLLSITDRKLNQKELAEWVEDFDSYLQVFTASGDPIEIPVVSSAIRNMKFERKQGRESRIEDFSMEQSEYDAIAVKSSGELPMPAVFIFTCEPYPSLPERRFEMRMSTIGNETLVLRIKKFEKHEEEMCVEFKDLVERTLTDQSIKHIQTYIGTFA